ncbi:inducible alternative oxidase 2 [Paramarasmius palmivorus]|uniref:Alternative oxidase n=1 Tax=Paramarasmius palmivorus TaxID=297713 RepID=A0AAW0DZI6_9AGAR
MLSTIVVRSHSILTRSAATCLLRQSRIAVGYPLSRGISSSSSSKNSLTDEKAQASSVGPHLQQRPVSSKSSEIHQHGGDPIVTGDWVLFHPVYSPDELKAVEVMHREATCFSDKVAASLVRLCRWGYDFVTGYKHKTLPPANNMTLAELRKEGYLLDDKAWLSVTDSLPRVNSGGSGNGGGNNASSNESQTDGTPRYFIVIHDINQFTPKRRDNGWIHTCLEEAENERMHLMTFMTLRKPSIFFRAMILGAQGVFYNLFFLSYLISPRISHRFVGYLEEEAVVTYTRCIKDIEAGYVPEWSDMPAPSIAIDYWRLPPDAKLLDVLYAVRSDETTHRFVNHSLANLNADNDVNPFALMEPDMHTKGKKIAFERSEAEQYLKETHRILREQHEAHAEPKDKHS